MGHTKRADDRSEGKKAPPKDEHAANREALIAKAVANLDTKAGDDKKLRKKLFTQGGKPDVASLEEELGFDISAEERDAAWETYQETQQG